MELQVATVYKKSRVEPNRAEEREGAGQIGGEIGLTEGRLVLQAQDIILAGPGKPGSWIPHLTTS